MARPRSRKQRWDHPLYNIGYCFNRDGVVHTNISYQNKRFRQATPFNWINENKKSALKILEERIIALMNPVELDEKQNENGISTVYVLIKKFSDLHVKNLSKTAQRKYTYACSSFIKKDFFLKQVDEIQDHISHNKNHCKLHDNTKRKLLMNLKQLFDYAISRGYMPRNPVIKEMLPKPVKSKNVVFSFEEVNTIVEYFEKNQKKEFALLIRFIANTGVRIAEAIRVAWKDINDGMILIHGKGNRERQFPIKPFPEVEQILNELKELNGNGSEYLFRWNSYAKLEKWIRDALKELKINKEVNFHAIRKMFENRLINDEDLDSNIVAEILGHSRRIQEQHYLEVLGAKRMEEIILRRRNKNEK